MIQHRQTQPHQAEANRPSSCRTRVLSHEQRVSHTANQSKSGGLLGLHESPRQNLRGANQRRDVGGSGVVIDPASSWFYQLRETNNPPSSGLQCHPSQIKPIQAPFTFLRQAYSWKDQYVLFSLTKLLLRKLIFLTRSRDIAAEAYQDAVRYLEKEFKADSQTLAWLSRAKCTTLDDLRVATQTVETQYRASRSKNGKMHWINGFSSRVMHYEKVFDALAQHHPEYVGLVWGIIKFVLMVRQTDHLIMIPAH